MQYLISILFILNASYSWGQFYIFGGYNFGAIEMKGTNVIVDQFNANENHQIPALKNNFHGYRIGIGKYSKNTIMELSFGNLISGQKSTTPNQLKENAEVIVNYMSAAVRFGYKPFPKYFFTVGAAFHLGAERIRYSFGGDYQTPVEEYTIAPEFYIDYAFRIKFLLKKSQREKYFYLLRIRPYYQLHQKLPIGNLETGLNQVPNIGNSAIEDQMSHFGFNISIIIPFINDQDRAYLFKTKKTKKKKKAKKSHL